MDKGTDYFITAKGEYLEEEELMDRFNRLEAKELGKTVEEVRAETRAREAAARTNKKTSKRSNSFIEAEDYATFILNSLVENINKRGVRDGRD